MKFANQDRVLGDNSEPEIGCSTIIQKKYLKI